MSIDFSKAAGVHAQALQLRAERTKVLASNIANVNTPGYQARDIDFTASLQAAVASDGDGALSLESDATAAGEPLYRVPYQPSRDGNTVEIGVEQAAFSQNALDFQTSLTFTNLQLKGLARAINGQ